MPNYLILSSQEAINPILKKRVLATGYNISIEMNLSFLDEILRRFVLNIPDQDAYKFLW